MLATSDNNNLNQIRSMIREAYACELGAGIYKSSSIADLHTIRSRDIKHNRSKVDPWNQTKAKPTRPPGRSIPLNTDYSRAHQHLLKRINRAPDKHKLIIYHIYKPDTQNRYLHDLNQVLWTEFEKTLKNKWRNTVDLVKLMMCLQLTVLNNPIKYQFLHDRPYRRFEIEYKKWDSTYKRHWSAVNDFILSADEAALHHVTR